MTTSETAKIVEEASEYKYGFTTDIEQEFAPKGLNDDIVKFISKKKNEPQWLLDWRLKAFNVWKKREYDMPGWANLKYDNIDLAILNAGMYLKTVFVIQNFLEC